MSFIPTPASLLQLATFAVPGFRPGVVSLLVNGMLYEGWVTVEVSRSVKEMAGQFTLKVSERWSGGNGPATLIGWRIRPGDACTVLYSGLPVVTGYVDAYNPRYDAENHEVTIQGRSKTADMVDSAAEPDVPNGELRKSKLKQAASRLTRPYGVTMKDQAPDAKRVFETMRVEPGETAHRFLERYARQDGVALTDDTDGALRLLQVQNGGPDAHLIEGVNILEASATLRADQRHSKYEGKGQRTGTDEKFGKRAAQVGADVADEAVKRYRPFVLLNETAADKEDARRRTGWEAAARAGESVRCEIKVIDWMSAPGRLWMPGMRAMVVSPMLAIERVLAVESVKHEQSDDQGTITSLSLTPVEALNPKAGGGGAGGKSDGAWTATKPEQEPK